MPKQLSDNRKAKITTIDEAKELFDSIAQSEILIARERARAEARIATIKKQAAEKIEQIDPALDTRRAMLAAFVETHPEQFTKPRHVSTDFGRFGLQSTTKVDVFNKTACIEFVVDQGMANCFETTYKPNAKGLQSAIESGSCIPGVKLLSGDIAHYTVKKALLDEAKGADQ